MLVEFQDKRMERYELVSVVVWDWIVDHLKERVNKVEFGVEAALWELPSN